MTTTSDQYPHGVPNGTLALLSKTGSTLLAAGPEGWPEIVGRVEVGWFLERAWRFGDVRDSLDVLHQLGDPQSSGNHAIDELGAILPVEWSVADAGERIRAAAAASSRREPWQEMRISRETINPDTLRG